MLVVSLPVERAVLLTPPCLCANSAYIYLHLGHPWVAAQWLGS